MSMDISGPAFTRACIRLLGDPVDWRHIIAHRLDVNIRTIERWAKNGLPADKAVRILVDLGLKPEDIADYLPRDEWAIAQGEQHHYVLHLHKPRFCARITENNQLTEIVWFSKQPPSRPAERLIASAAEYLLENPLITDPKSPPAL